MPHVHESEVAGVTGSGGEGHLLKHLIAPWTMGSESLWVGFTTLQPGTSTRMSAIAGSESAHVTVEGTGREIVEGETIETRPGSFVLIPQGALHQVVNTGDVPLRLVTMASPPVTKPA